MFFTVALTRVVPQFVSLLGNEAADSRELEPVERAIWERLYGAIAIADREASVILHTIIHSVTSGSSSKGQGQGSSEETSAHDPTLASMYPAPPQKTIKALNELTPEMEAMVIEANIKNQRDGPIGQAWRGLLPHKPSENGRLTRRRALSTPELPAEAVGSEREMEQHTGGPQMNGFPRLPRTSSVTRLSNGLPDGSKVQSPNRNTGEL